MAFPEWTSVLSVRLPSHPPLILANCISNVVPEERTNWSLISKNTALESQPTLCDEPRWAECWVKCVLPCTFATSHFLRQELMSHAMHDPKDKLGAGWSRSRLNLVRSRKRLLYSNVPDYIVVSAGMEKMCANFGWSKDVKICRCTMYVFRIPQVHTNSWSSRPRCIRSWLVSEAPRLHCSEAGTAWHAYHDSSDPCSCTLGKS